MFARNLAVLALLVAGLASTGCFSTRSRCCSAPPPPVVAPAFAAPAPACCP